MIMQSTLRRGTKYIYLLRRGLQRHDCDTRYVDVETIEDEPGPDYSAIHIPEDLANRMREILDETLADLQKATQLRSEQLSKEVARLDAQEENLLDLVADGNVPSTKVKVRLNRLDQQRQAVERELAAVSEGLESGIASPSSEESSFLRTLRALPANGSRTAQADERGGF